MVIKTGKNKRSSQDGNCKVKLVYSRGGQPVLYKKPKLIEAITERAVTRLFL